MLRVVIITAKNHYILKQNIQMKTGMRSISIFLAVVILLAGCSSSTMIQSTPGKAKVYLDGTLVGETPYLHKDAKVVGTSMQIRLEKEGYNPLYTTITKDEEPNVGAIIGGVLVVVPLLWTMQYQPVHSYALKPLAPENEVKPEVPKRLVKHRSKVERLRELKQLLDEKIITPDEFKKEKTKVLDSQDEY